MSDRQFMRLTAVALVALYLVWVPATCVLKATTPLFRHAPWPEMIYGPAITVACVLAVLAAVTWIGKKLRRPD